jgi:hypothetical protein
LTFLCKSAFLDFSGFLYLECCILVLKRIYLMNFNLYEHLESRQNFYSFYFYKTNLCSAPSEIIKDEKTDYTRQLFKSARKI